MPRYTDFLLTVTEIWWIGDMKNIIETFGNMVVCQSLSKIQLISTTVILGDSLTQCTTS